MTEITKRAATTADGFPVDTSKKHAIIGQCEQCGQYKTWDFKVPNKKTGKMMPGHVTAEGFKIGEGECPKWARIASTNAKRAAGQAGAPSEPGAWIRDVTGERAASNVHLATAPAHRDGPVSQPVPATQARQAAEPGTVVSFTVNGFTVTTSAAQALGVIEQIAACLRSSTARDSARVL